MELEIEKVAWQVPGRRLTAAAASVTGERYTDNYDVVHLDPAGPVAVVADGMGDGPGSALAGRVAVDTFVDVLRGTDRCSPASLRAAVAEVQLAVRQAGSSLDVLTGCTLTAVVGDPAEASVWVVQLGDSRVYRLRAGLLELLTTDHTIAWLGLLHGWFAPDSPEAHAARYRLTRYAGHPDAPEPDVLNVAVAPGDVLLACTDGIADQLSYERLTQVLSGTGDPAAAVHVLLSDTLTAGGADNATAVVVKVEPTV